ncbi:MAG: hypothetical protein AAFY26_00760 [Cyanobacteria bacterium J06638_22]
MKLSLLPDARKSSFPTSPYIAELQLVQVSQLLTWQEVCVLHQTALDLCPQRFSWWCGLPPELWFVSQIDYLVAPPKPETLSDVYALRIDIKEGYQFSAQCKVLLTLQQLITLRKIAYRVKSDFMLYARNQNLPTRFEAE